MLHFPEDHYVEFLRNYRSITVLRLDHRWHVYRATCADARCEKLECLPAPGGKHDVLAMLQTVQARANVITKSS